MEHTRRVQNEKKGGKEQIVFIFIDKYSGQRASCIAQSKNLLPRVIGIGRKKKILIDQLPASTGITTFFCKYDRLVEQNKKKVNEKVSHIVEYGHNTCGSFVLYSALNLAWPQLRL